MKDFQEWLGEEALHHIRTMYPGLWEKFGASAKKSLMNHINNNFNMALQEVRARENEACAKLIENFQCQEHEDKDLCEHYCESKKVFIQQIRRRMSQAESE